MIDPRTELLLSKAKFTFIRDQGCCGRTADNPADLEWAAAKAYLDMAPRTIKGLGSASSATQKRIRSLSVATASEVADMIRGSLPEKTNRQQEFDRRHDDLCEGFLSHLNNIIDEHNQSVSDDSREKTIEHQEYGKAQKMVNMLFKYFSCFSDAAEHRIWFELYHMPIDTYVLSWCKRNGIATQKEAPWSNLGREDYIGLQAQIREKLAEGTLEVEGIPLPERPLDAEFIIWAAQRKRGGSRN